MSGEVGDGHAPLAARSGAITLSSYVLVTLVLAVGVFLVAYAKPFGNSPDYENYDEFFDFLRLTDWQALGLTRFEPGFALLSLLLTQVVSSNAVVYAALASMAIVLKAGSFRSLELDAAGVMVLIAFYATRFLPLHELTQLRAAFATALLLLVWVLAQARAWLVAAVVAVASVAFHYSAAMVVPALFVRVNSRRSVLLAGLAALVVVSVGIGAVVQILLNGPGPLAMYEVGGYGDAAPNPLAPAIVLDWTMITAGLVLWHRLTPGMKHILLLEVLGISVYYGATEFPVIAHRVREMFTVFWVFFVALGWQAKGVVRSAAIGLALLSIALYSYLFVFRGGFFS